MEVSWSYLHFEHILIYIKVNNLHIHKVGCCQKDEQSYWGGSIMEGVEELSKKEKMRERTV